MQRRLGFALGFSVIALLVSGCPEKPKEQPAPSASAEPAAQTAPNRDGDDKDEKDEKTEKAEKKEQGGW
jgi:hypothetical protein